MTLLEYQSRRLKPLWKLSALAMSGWSVLALILLCPFGLPLALFRMVPLSRFQASLIVISLFAKHLSMLTIYLVWYTKVEPSANWKMKIVALLISFSFLLCCGINLLGLLVINFIFSR